MAAADEQVEVVDAAGGVLGVVSRSEMRSRRLRHRTVFVAVLDRSATRVAVHRRAPWKDLWPHRWDLAFGGVVAVGEAWDDAARRELAEEAGIRADLESVGEVVYDDEDVSELARVYVARHDGPFRFADGEVVESGWVDLCALDDWIARTPVVPDSVAVLAGHLRGFAR